MDTKALQGLLENFTTAFYENMKQAENSGALRGDETTVNIGRAVLILTARQFAPMSKDGKKILHELEFYI